MRFENLPIKSKLLVVITGTSVLALALACGGFITYELAAGGAPALAFSDEKDARETLAVMGVDPHVVAAGLYGRNGILFASYSRPDSRGEPPRSAGSDGHRFSWDHSLTSLNIESGTVRPARRTVPSSFQLLGAHVERVDLPPPT